MLLNGSYRLPVKLLGPSGTTIQELPVFVEFKNGSAHIPLIVDL